MKTRQIPRTQNFAETVEFSILTATPILNTCFSAQFDKYLLILSISENKCKSKKQVQIQEITAETRNVRCFRHTTNFCRICAHPRVSERVKILMCLDADYKVPQVQ